MCVCMYVRISVCLCVLAHIRSSLRKIQTSILTRELIHFIGNTCELHVPNLHRMRQRKWLSKYK